MKEIKLTRQQWQDIIDGLACSMERAQYADAFERIERLRNRLIAAVEPAKRGRPPRG